MKIYGQFLIIRHHTNPKADNPLLSDGDGGGVAESFIIPDGDP